MQFHDFILANMEAILKEWEKFARSLPPGSTMSIEELRNDAQSILQTISYDMSISETSEQQTTKSKGDAGLNELAMSFARRHASGRYQSGFDINHVVSEYRALRSVVIRLWTDEVGFAGRDTLYQLIRFNEALDQALTYSISEFSRHTQQPKS